MPGLLLHFFVDYVDRAEVLLAFFTFLSVCIMNYDIRILSVLSLGVPVFVRT